MRRIEEEEYSPLLFESDAEQTNVTATVVSCYL